MKKIIFAVIVFFLCLPASVMAHPSNAPLSGEYTITAQTLSLGVDSWRFLYTITNNTVGSGNYTGLDGFYVMVPLTANITNIVVPDPYITSPSGAYWTSFYDAAWPPIDTTTYQWLKFWGVDPKSVYPANSSAVFSFDASNVHVGSNQGYVVSYFYDDALYYQDPNYWYHTYYSSITGPVPNVPEPATVLLVGFGLVGLAGMRRFKK